MERVHFENDDSNFTVQLLIVKVDSQGNIQWTRNYGGAEVFNIVYDVIQTRDGGFAIVGYCGMPLNDEYGPVQMLLIKTTVNGEFGLAMTGSTANTVTLYRGDSDPYWNYVRVRIWVVK
jgi:hypothetical protein